MKKTSAARKKFEIRSYFHGDEILEHCFPNEHADLEAWMADFEFGQADILVGGGARSLISKRIDDFFLRREWHEQKFDLEMTVNAKKLVTESHKIDNFKNRIGAEVEWNNKTEFFDRDLNNFRHLHQLNALSVGIIITRSTSLNSIFNKFKLKQKYGASTTHFDKAVHKVDRGLSGTCPIILIGITEKCFV